MSLRIEVPGKLFLLGEYSVLGGGRALVAAVPRRFELTETPGPMVVHPDSPAGRLAGLRRIALEHLTFADPWHGQGGFGASTAQFAALWFLSELDRTGVPPQPSKWQDAWAQYQELQGPARGSGADLVAQWSGGVTLWNAASRQAQNVTSSWDWSGLMVFSATNEAGRKTDTHAHLGELQARGGLSPTQVARLDAGVEEALVAFEKDPDAQGESLEAVGRALNVYGDVLREFGLEDPRTTEDRSLLRTLPGVMGVKGCGARQSDALVVLWDRRNPDLVQKQAVIDAAQARGLVLVTDRLITERGITWRV